MIGKRAFFVGLALLGAALAYPYVRGMATEPQASAPHQDNGPVAFGAPEHAVFFKYQVYLTSNKKEGTTPEKWNTLPPQKQHELLAAGETMLKTLHKELLAKPQLNAEETELFQAVWGKDDNSTPAGIPVSPTAAAGAKTLNNEKVEEIFSSIESSKKVANWGQLFDGGGNRSDEAVTLTAAPAGRRVEKDGNKPFPSRAKFNTPPALRTVPSPVTDSSAEHSGTSSKTLPMAAGAILITGASFVAWAFRGKFSGNNSSPESIHGKSIPTSDCKPLNFSNSEVLTLEKAKIQSEFESLPDMKGCKPFGFSCPTKGNDPTCGTKGNGPCKCFMGDLDCSEHCNIDYPCSCKGPVGYIPQDDCHPYTTCPGNTNCRPVES